MKYLLKTFALVAVIFATASARAVIKNDVEASVNNFTGASNTFHSRVYFPSNTTFSGGVNFTSGFITNNGIIIYSTNGAPLVAAPDGSLAVGTGQIYTRTNGAWVALTFSGGGAATNVWKLQVGDTLLTLGTNATDFVYTLTIGNANLQAWAAIAPSAKQGASANLTSWAALAPSAKQDASANLTSWSALAPSAKQDASANLASWSSLAPSAKQDHSANLDDFSNRGTNVFTTTNQVNKLIQDGTLDPAAFAIENQSNLFVVLPNSNLLAVGLGPDIYVGSDTNLHVRNTGGGTSILGRTNLYARITNAVVWDPSVAQTFNVGLLTNSTLIITNPSGLTNYENGQVSWHQTTNGFGGVPAIVVIGGLLRTNGTGAITTNANATDSVLVRLDPTGTNVILTWQTNCSTYIDTNTLNTAGGGGGGSPIIAGSQVYLKDDNNTGSTSSDASGNGFNATLSGTTPPAWSAPYIGVASLFFDGTSSYMATATSAAFSPDSNDATITVWMKTTVKQLGTVWGMVNNSSGRYFIINFTSNGFIDGAAQGGGGPAGISANGQDYSDGAWHFVVAEYDHTAGTVSLWVDDVSIGTSGATGTPLSIGTVAMTAGQFGTTGGSFYLGYADEHVLYPSMLDGTTRHALFIQGHP